MSFTVILEDETATAVLRRIPPNARKRLRGALAVLARNPYATNQEANIRRLETDPAKDPVYRLRDGSWRLVYTIDGNKVRIVRVMHRDEGYDWLE